MDLLNNLVTGEMWVRWANPGCEKLAVPPGLKVVCHCFEVLSAALLGGVRDQCWSESHHAGGGTECTLSKFSAAPLAKLGRSAGAQEATSQRKLAKLQEWASENSC